MNRRLVTTVGIAVVAVIVALGVWILTPPGMPREWRRLKLGMSRQQVSSIVTDPMTDFRDVKGFDMTGRAYNYAGARYHWILTIQYDAGGRVNQLHAQTSNSLTGLIDQTPWSRGG